jgi:hypothetical protein
MTNRTRTGVAVAAASVGVIANTVATLATAFSCACRLRCGGGELDRRLRVSVQRKHAANRKLRAARPGRVCAAEFGGKLRRELLDVARRELRQ